MASKTMSSRLLTMKFMQRGIASSSASSPTTPKAEDDHASKRRKYAQSPTDRRQSGANTVDEKAVQAALEEEERKRQAAIAKQAEELGDTRWVLDFPATPPPTSGKVPQTPLNVVQIGFAQIDSADSAVGGGQIRRFNMTKAKSVQNDDMDTGSESEDSDSDADRYGDNSPTGNAGSAATRGRQLVTDSGKRKRTKSETSSRRSVERTKAQQFSAKRRKKEVKLNMPTSISSANHKPPQSRSGKGHR